MEMRPYQVECIAAHLKYAHQKVKRQLVAMPTGTGKTVMFAQIPQKAQGRRVLVIAHRTELLAQAATKISESNPDLKVEIEQAGQKASPATQVIVASIQTLAVSPERLENLDPDNIGVVIIDEAHHATAKTYLRVLYRFGLAPDPDSITNYQLTAKKLNSETRKLFMDFQLPPNAPYLFGYTATPHRTDGIGLEYVFDEIVFQRSIQDMMKEGWLADIRGIQIPTETDIEDVKVSRGDYQEKALSEMVNTKPRNETLVNAYLAHAPDRQALCFCVDVEHTEAVTEAFQEAGVNTAMVVGTTKADCGNDSYQH